MIFGPWSLPTLDAGTLSRCGAPANRNWHLKAPACMSGSIVVVCSCLPAWPMPFSSNSCNRRGKARRTGCCTSGAVALEAGLVRPAYLSLVCVLLSVTSGRPFPLPSSSLGAPLLAWPSASSKIRDEPCLKSGQGDHKFAQFIAGDDLVPGHVRLLLHAQTL